MADALTTSTTIAGRAGCDPQDLPPRPQPLGLFPLPLGYMLIPAGKDTEAVREMLLAGQLPDSWPPSLRVHELAAAGDREGAIAALSEQSPDRIDPVSRYNRFVLDPDSIDADELRCSLGQFAVLVDVVLFALGRTDTPPHAETIDGEIAAAVMSAQASHALAHGDTSAAVDLLDQATLAAETVSAPLAGTLRGGAAAICRDSGAAGCVERLQKAVADLDGADELRITRAEIHMCLAGVLHEQAQQRPELLATAIPHYHSTLQLIKRDDAPLLWAAAHAGLAAAYLTMPMVEASSQLRLGVAAQSLRSALMVYTRDEHPHEWASVQLNLANSLVYTPSRHHRENLVEAVELYEGAGHPRSRHRSPRPGQSARQPGQCPGASGRVRRREGQTL